MYECYWYIVVVLIFGYIVANFPQLDMISGREIVVILTWLMRMRGLKESFSMPLYQLVLFHRMILNMACCDSWHVKSVVIFLDYVEPAVIW